MHQITNGIKDKTKKIDAKYMSKYISVTLPIYRSRHITVPTIKTWITQARTHFGSRGAFQDHKFLRSQNIHFVSYVFRSYDIPSDSLNISYYKLE